MYEACPQSWQPFWISQEPVAWPWCNIAASQRRPYCTSVNSHSPVGLVSRQWDAAVWPSHLHILLSVVILALGKPRSRRVPKRGCGGGGPDNWVMGGPPPPPNTIKTCRMAVECAGALMQICWSARSVIVNATVTVNKLSQWRLTADWLSQLESEFTDELQGFLWLAAKLHQCHMTGSPDIQNCWILFGQAS
jgi:hypothetical protein